MISTLTPSLATGLGARDLLAMGIRTKLVLQVKHGMRDVAQVAMLAEDEHPATLLPAVMVALSSAVVRTGGRIERVLAAATASLLSDVLGMEIGSRHGGDFVMRVTIHEADDRLEVPIDKLLSFQITQVVRILDGDLAEVLVYRGNLTGTIQYANEARKQVNAVAAAESLGVLRHNGSPFNEQVFYELLKAIEMPDWWRE